MIQFPTDSIQYYGNNSHDLCKTLISNGCHHIFDLALIQADLSNSWVFFPDARILIRRIRQQNGPNRTNTKRPNLRKLANQKYTYKKQEPSGTTLLLSDSNSSRTASMSMETLVRGHSEAVKQQTKDAVV